MVLISFLNSSHEVLNAASYKRGGRNTRNIISGSNLRFGRKGTNPIIKPANTNRIGVGNLNLSVKAERITITVTKKITITKLLMRKDSDNEY
jgi:hypothetical protein